MSGANALLRLYLDVLPVAIVVDALLTITLVRWIRGRRSS